MASKPSILILLLAVAITASPLRGFVGSHAPEEGPGHAHHHAHDADYHSHQHHHDDDEDDSSPEGDHHSVIDNGPDGPTMAWTAPRRIEVAAPMLAPVMAFLAAPSWCDWQAGGRAKPPPWVPPGRSSQVSHIRTVVLLV